MSRFIQVHDTHGTEYYINTRYIDEFWSNGKDCGCNISLIGFDNNTWFTTQESYEEVKNILMNNKNISNNNIKKEKILPLTMNEISGMIKEPIWNSGNKQWYLIFDYVRGNEGDFFSVVDNNQDIYYMNKDFLMDEPFYHMKDVTKILGSGDLLYCENCQGDLSSAYVENLDTCPHCGKIFTNTESFRR